MGTLFRQLLDFFVLAWPAIAYFAAGLTLLFLGRRQLRFVLKQMRQRALSTALTLLSVVLGVALAIAVLIFMREGRAFFSQGDFGYDLIVGPKGAPLQLVLNTVYHMEGTPQSIDYAIYDELRRNNFLVRLAVPMLIGDKYEGHRVIATVPNIVPVDHDGQRFPANRMFQYRKDRTFELAQGRGFHPLKFETVIGSEVARLQGLKLGDKIKVQHDEGRVEGDEHNEQWTVVGILQPTRTANDKVLFIPLVSSYAIPAHAEGMDEMEKFRKAYEAARQGRDPTTNPATTRPATRPATAPATTQAHDDDEHAGHDHEHAYHLHGDEIHLLVPREQWRLTAVYVQTRGGFQHMSLLWGFNQRTDAMAVEPAPVMRQFFDTFLAGFTQLLLVISILVTVVAAVGILVSIYNAITARKKEIAIMRALGATRGRVLMIICVEAGMIGLAGSLIGLLIGHGVGLGVSVYMERLFGQSMHWLTPGQGEWLYLLGVVMLSVLAGLVPALKAYQTPVADNLVAS